MTDMEFSKKWLIFSGAFSMAMTVLCAFGIPVESLTLAAYAEVSVSTGFYYWKAKNENREKYTKRMIDKYAEQYGIDAALQAAEIITKE